MVLEWDLVQNGGKCCSDSCHMIFRERTWDVYKECILSEDDIDQVFATRAGRKQWESEKELIDAIEAGQVARRVV